MTEQPLRLTVVPGVTPTRWLRTWQRRHPEQRLDVRVVDEHLDDTGAQADLVRRGEADLGFVRLPCDREALHVIPLWHEQPVVVVSREHVVSVLDEVTLDDLAGEHRWDLEELSVQDAVEAVAAGTGVLLVPGAVARLHHRKDVVAVPVIDAPQSRIGLVWRVDHDGDPRLEEFIGVVRGRTERSSRGDRGSSEPEQAAPKARPTAKAKAAAKAAAQARAAERKRSAPRGGRARGRGRR